MNKEIIIRRMAKGMVCVALTLSFSACNYLDVVPVETADETDMLTDAQNAQRYLYGCYGTIQSDKARVLQYSNTFMGSDEFVECTSVYDYFRYQQGDLVTGGNAGQYGVWNLYYDGIGYCNQFIRDMNAYKVYNLSNSDREQYLAEAEFLKAYYHYKLLNAYGPIPIMDELASQNTPKDQLKGRSHFDAVVEYIVNLCEKAYPNLPVSYSNPAYYGRATKAVCKMLEAKVRLLAASPLWNGSFPEKNWKNKNFETPGYGQELVSKTYDPNKWKVARDACYAAVKEAESAGCELMDTTVSETLRKNDNIPLPQIPGNDLKTKAGQDFAKRVMLMRYVPAARPDQGNKEFIWASFDILNRWAHSPASIPHYVLLDENNLAKGGWGMVNPTLYTVEHFYTKNGVLPAEDQNFTREESWFKSAGLSNKNIINLCVGREPRFYASISFDGDEYSPVIADGHPLIVNARDAQEAGYNTAKYGQNNNSQTGFWNKKLVHPNFRYQKIGGGSNIGDVENHPYSIFRLGDLYLMLAECDAHLGGEYLSEGIDYLNRIRTRAGVPPVTANSVAADGALLKTVLNERFAELYFEGMRFEDIRRYLQGAERMSRKCYQGLNALVSNPSFETFNVPTQVEQVFSWSDREYIQPIPDDELYSNPQLVQAPGY